MKTRNLIFKCVKEFEMYILYDVLHKNYKVNGFKKRFTNKEMLNLILEESEQHKHYIPLSAKQQRLIEKVLKKLEKYGN